jgi:His-Xaa-Ser system radical SAM maturase HxsC
MSMKWTAFAAVERLSVPAVLRVTDIDGFVRSRARPEQCALLVGPDMPSAVRQRATRHTPWGALVGDDVDVSDWSGPRICTVTRGPPLQSGDIIALDPQRSMLRYLHRQASCSNVLFVTTRCNCRCVMCSQPPRHEDDRLRHAELLAQIELTDPGIRELGITGGEPTLLGERLVELIAHAKACLPTTSLHILTNARLFADGELATSVGAVGHPDLMWGVPLNAEVARIHDEIMGASGAFAEASRGIHQLLARQQRVEIRIIVQKKNVERLPELARYLFWNFPNVEHVAFMGLEPMGWARKHQADVQIDIAEHAQSLGAAVHYLADRGMATSIYNVPLCLLPQDLWTFSRQSISDWKNRYLPTCERCVVRARCAGFFDSATPDWISPHVRAISEERRAG